MDGDFVVYTSTTTKCNRNHLDRNYTLCNNTNITSRKKKTILIGVIGTYQQLESLRQVSGYRSCSAGSVVNTLTAHNCVPISILRIF